MPTYVYKFVDTGETIEVQQAFTDDSLTEYAHPESGHVLPVKKVFQPVGVTFKGSGFFKTDNRGSSATTPPGSSSDSSTAGSSDSSSSDSSNATKSTTSDTSGSSTKSDASSKTSTSPSKAATTKSSSTSD